MTWYTMLMTAVNINFFVYNKIQMHTFTRLKKNNLDFDSNDWVFWLVAVMILKTMSKSHYMQK